MVLVGELESRRQHLDNNVQPEQRRRGLKPTHQGIIAWHVLALIYYCYSNLLGCDAQSTDPVRLLDLSHTFDDTTIYWVTAKKLNFTVVHNGTDEEGKNWYQADEISAATHGGTHMDAPCHYALGRWCISDIPARHLATEAVVVDISREVGDNPNVHLTADHLKGWERAHGRIPDGSLLLVRTGWSRFWPDPLTYTGTTERKKSQLKFPSIKPDAAKWLVANRQIVGIGIDVMSVDVPTRPDEVPSDFNPRLVHVTLMEKNIYALENVNLAHPLPPKGVKVYALPMKLKNASGAPCRIFAEVSTDLTNGNVGSSNSFSQFWITVAVAVFWLFKNRRF